MADVLVLPLPDGGCIALDAAALAAARARAAELGFGRAQTAEPSAASGETLVDSRAMAKLLACGDTLVEAMARDGRIPSIRVGLPGRNGDVKGLRFEPSKVIAALRGGE